MATQGNGAGASRAAHGASSHSLEMASSNQGLVSKDAKSRRWVPLLWSLGLLVALVVLVVVVVLAVNGDSDEKPVSRNLLTLDDVLRRRFTARQFNASWLTDNELYFDDGTTNVPIVYDVEKRTRTSPFKFNVTLEVATFQTQPSADQKYVLESYNYRSLYRHSYLALYNIIDVMTSLKYPLTDPTTEGNTPAFVQLVVWSSANNALAFVHGNDIWYRPHVLAQSQRITNTGAQDTIYNGVPDWVYEEEVLSSNQAMWFSPDGGHLAYVTYNDTFTPVMTLPYYGRPGDLEHQYTRLVRIRYPKPGTPNPIVTLSVVDLNTKNVVVIPAPDVLKGRLAIETPVLALTQWVTESKLLAVWMNRVQNHAIAQVCSVSSSTAQPRCTTLLERQEPRGWVDLFEPGVVQGGRVLLPLSQAVGNDSFRHVTRFDPNQDGTLYTATPLTSGTFVVTSILAWDAEGGYVYFVSTDEKDPASSLVQRVSDSVSGAPHKPECLSCQLENCRYASASLSKANAHIAITCTGPGVPYTVLYQTRKGKTLTKEMNWESNDSIRNALSAKDLPTKKRMTAPLPGGMTAQVMLWLPPGVDTSGNTLYPMVVDVYGGPNSFRVSERFAIDWGTYLSANQSIIYAAIDGRGSANKGDNTVFAINRAFGTVEVEDQIHVTRHIQNLLPYVDKSRTAIWGWSYGGYASAMALAKDDGNVFKCGMSVAPVTDWIYYDSIYTERYMGLPTVQDNLEGYGYAQLNNKVKGLKNKKFLLVHGTLDDNVHYQQSMMLSRALEENDILFRQQSYPDEEHGLVNLQHHLYHTLQNFLKECFATV